MTIRQKLTLYWAAVLAAILVVAACSVFVIFRGQQWGALDAALIEEADTSASAIARADAGAAALVVQRLSQERDLGPAKRVRLIAGDAVVADYGSPQADLPATDGSAAHRGVVDGSRRVYRFAVMPLLLGNQPAILEDGVDASAVRNSVARLGAILLVLTPLLLAASVAGGYWMAGRSLAPIGSLADDLARIDPRELDRRLSAGTAQDEVARLAASINALLDRLQAASATERRFLSDAAHELRTPLTVLRTGLEIALGRERGADELREALRAALRAAIALCATADELLAMAALSEEAFGRRAAVNIGDLVGEAVDAVEPLVQAKNLTMTADCASTLIVEGNPEHLRRLIVNLLDNAIKFTPESGRVAIALEERENAALLRVTDSGPGIAPGDLPFIFERFFRGAGHNRAGSGLGLSLCREIVRLHHGQISARNKPEGGCEVVVTLPLRGAHSARFIPRT
jgi:two-component system OmpR family sensor kinase